MRNKRKNAAMLVNLTLAVIIAGLYIALTAPYAADAAAVSGLPIYKGRRSDRVALQCMVTWDAAAVPGILDILKERNVRITFAVSGEWAELNADILKRMAEDGHEIATVGYGGDSDAGGLSAVRVDLKRAADAIRGITGSAPKLFCCTGKNAGISARAAAGLNMAPVMCTIDLVCTNGTAGDIFGRVVGNAGGGDIMLVMPTAAFSEALPYILDYLASKGLTASTISSTVYG